MTPEEMTDTRLSERNIAYKVAVEDITRGSYTRSDSRWEPGYVLTPLGERVSRVRVMGVAVSKFVSEDSRYASITLDDGSDTILVKGFREDAELLMDVKPGDTVDVVGKVKEYGGERYINVESVWRVEDPNWEVVRRLELLLKRKEAAARGEAPEAAPPAAAVGETAREGELEWPAERGAVEVTVEEVLEEEAPEEGEEDPKAAVLKMIETLDEGEGVKYVTLLRESGLDEDALETVLNDLMQEGDIYEPKIGRFKRV
jgi:hypothetical protein